MNMQIDSSLRRGSYFLFTVGRIFSSWQVTPVQSGLSEAMQAPAGVGNAALVLFYFYFR